MSKYSTLSEAYKRVLTREANLPFGTGSTNLPNLGQTSTGSLNPTTGQAGANMSLPQIIDNINKLKLQLDTIVTAIANFQKNLVTQQQQQSAMMGNVTGQSATNPMSMTQAGIQPKQMSSIR